MPRRTRTKNMRKRDAFERREAARALRELTNELRAQLAEDEPEAFQPVDAGADDDQATDDD